MGGGCLFSAISQVHKFFVSNFTYFLSNKKLIYITFRGGGWGVGGTGRIPPNYDYIPQSIEALSPATDKPTK